MSETTEMMMDGTLCQVCGVIMEDISANHDLEAPGYPRTCSDCKPKRRRKRRARSRREAQGE